MEEFCKSHTTLVADIAVIKNTTEAIDKRINGSIDDIHDHIKSGVAWRMSIIGIAFLIFCQIIGFVFMWSRLCTIVGINTGRITNLEDLFPRTRGEQGIQGIQGIPGKYGK